MKYGFIIDNRKCIGCHACTVACKSEHDVPVGVNRTWVKQVEKGEYPHTQRVFSVMRCNHCTDAPCVSICPVEALHTREDGIVDFDNERCIGCKACMQACPYDALYIDPETHTAAKCNYCAHRVDIGLEPACVNVCPEHAIISGDMEDPTSEISQLLGTNPVTVRKPEKDTSPNVFYINGDEASLTPGATETSDSYLWSSQSGGVGHFAKYAENKKQGSDPSEMASTLAGNSAGKTQVQAIMEKTRRVYDAPSKGTLWGWEVSAYIWTKAIAAGVALLPILALLFGFSDVSDATEWVSIGVGIVFLIITTILLVKDLDKPTRFVYVLLRPQWKSWLVKGGYAITLFGGLLTLWAVAKFMEWDMLRKVVMSLTGIFAIITAVYTAFLFAQAKGRDFWQSPTLFLHMLVHSVIAGASVLAILALVQGGSAEWMKYLKMAFYLSIGFNLLITVLELYMPHATADAKRTVSMIIKGKYKNQFWFGAIVLGNIIPLVLISMGASPLLLCAAGVTALIGSYITEHIWVQAPQQISLS